MATSVSLSWVLDSQPHLSVPVSLCLSICLSHVANRQFCPLSPHLQVIQGWMVLNPS